MIQKIDLDNLNFSQRDLKRRSGSAKIYINLYWEGILAVI
jgi:hypothetical protein